MKKTFFLLFAITFGLSCHKDNYKSGKLSGFNVSDAKILFIEQTSNKLYKISATGQVQEVTMTDGSGKTYSKGMDNLINLHDGNVILTIGRDDAYFVKISDGSSFGFSQHTPKNRNIEKYYFGEISSKFGNSYIYVSNEYDGAQLIKMDVANPSSLAFEVYGQAGDAIESFCSDIYGNVIYNNWKVTKYRKPDGNFETFSSEIGTSTYWTSMKDDTIYFSGHSPILNKSIIRKIIPSPFQLVDYSNDFVSMASYGLLKIKNKNRIVAVGLNISYLYNGLNTARDLLWKDISIGGINTCCSSDNFYYIAGKDLSDKPILLKIDPSNDNYQALVNGEYSISKMACSPDDEVLFCGTRTSDGKTVIGQISALGTITILDENRQYGVQVMEWVK